MRQRLTQAELAQVECLAATILHAQQTIEHAERCLVHLLKSDNDFGSEQFPIGDAVDSMMNAHVSSEKKAARILREALGLQGL